VWVSGLQLGEALVEFGTDQGWLGDQAGGLAPDEFVEGVRANRRVGAHLAVLVAPAVRAQASVAVERCRRRTERVYRAAVVMAVPCQDVARRGASPSLGDHDPVDGGQFGRTETVEDVPCDPSSPYPPSNLGGPARRPGHHPCNQPYFERSAVHLSRPPSHTASLPPTSS
jgi:hypothetical protein